MFVSYIDILRLLKTGVSTPTKSFTTWVSGDSQCISFANYKQQRRDTCINISRARPLRKPSGPKSFGKYKYEYRSELDVIKCNLNMTFYCTEYNIFAPAYTGVWFHGSNSARVVSLIKQNKKVGI